MGLTQPDVGQGLSGRGDLAEHLNPPRFGQHSTDSGHLTARQSTILRSFIFVRVGHELRSLRDYSKFPKLCKLPPETLMRVNTIRKACLADLDCA